MRTVANSPAFSAGAAAPRDGIFLPMWAVYPADRPPGPAGRWLIARLRDVGGDA